MLIFVFSESPVVFSKTEISERDYVAVDEMKWFNFTSLARKGYMPESVKSLADISQYGSTEIDCETVVKIRKGIKLIDLDVLPFNIGGFLNEIVKLIDGNSDSNLSLWVIGD